MTLDEQIAWLRDIGEMCSTVPGGEVTNEIADTLQAKELLVIAVKQRNAKLETRVTELEFHLGRVLSAVRNDTGAEPSVSVLGRAYDEAKAAEFMKLAYEGAGLQ